MEREMWLYADIQDQICDLESGFAIQLNKYNIGFWVLDP